MGMYTELSIGVRFKNDAPKDVIDALHIMTRESLDGPVPPVPASIADHPLFKTDRWDWMLRSGGSYYFDAQPSLVWEFDEITKAWNLSVRTNIKNYSQEWESFLDFIAPHLENEGFIGTYRYEEDEHPTLVYVLDGKPILKPVTAEIVL